MGRPVSAVPGRHQQQEEHTERKRAFVESNTNLRTHSMAAESLTNSSVGQSLVEVHEC